MVEDVKRYRCDACRNAVSSDMEKVKQTWAINTEVGDLCPRCSRIWEEFKQSFIEKMRLDNNEDII
jgi:hypothetical protein